MSKRWTSLFFIFNQWAQITSTHGFVLHFAIGGGKWVHGRDLTIMSDVNTIFRNEMLTNVSGFRSKTELEKAKVAFLMC